ncbi:hypothetical protein [Actinoplanes rectilineatus]|uniref:hypothetical protein n=1 Tax=Actinoplanes rectilineatus TaxID=113571 RepID=UPI000697595D|nr:hypothetical protein [Actinoplanes rectilineatus]
MPLIDSPLAAAASVPDGWRIVLIAAIVLGVVVLPLVAALDIARSRRRRPAAPLPDDMTGPLLLRAPAATRGVGQPTVGPLDPMGAWAVDRVLRVLATACRQTGRPFPALAVAEVDPARVVLRLAVPDDRPAEPWTASENGRVWTAAFLALQAAPVDLAVPVPDRRLVSLGAVDDTRILLDLGQCHGIVAVTGPGPALRTLARTWLAELSANAWSAKVPLVAAGFGADGPGGAVAVRDAAAALDSLGTPEAGTPSGVVILAEPPQARVAAALAEVVAAPGRDGWSVVAFGGAAGARWEFTLHPDGRLDTGVLGIVTRAPLAAAS